MTPRDAALAYRARLDTVIRKLAELRDDIPQATLSLAFDENLAVAKERLDLAAQEIERRIER